jgi:hypothetical protein
MRTGVPARRNAAAIADPTKPLAPVTKTGFKPAAIGLATLQGCGEIPQRIVSARHGQFIRKMDTECWLHCIFERIVPLQIADAAGLWKMSCARRRS